ncbi:MAG: hypothetical protein JSS20_04495 [Proteobacteria bacterium]|nr:hypothetical protein [Pseudomonadota bacterium]
MPLQNRVTPEGDIVATPARGLMMGNRGGAFHDAEKRLGKRRWASRQWICCLLRFKGRHREVMAPRRYTELFFLDEATALAAGHRPCFECRRDDALEFSRAWAKVHGEDGRASADAMDEVLHHERLAPGALKRTYRALFGDLPDATFVRHADEPHLVLNGRLLPWTFDGYRPALVAAAGDTFEILTPPTIVRILAVGFKPSLHPTATQ